MLELRQQIGLEDGGACAIQAAPIAECPWALSVVAGQQTLHPTRGKGHGCGDLADLVAFGQEPDGVEVARRRGVLARAIVLLQRQHAQMLCDIRHGASPRFMAPESIGGSGLRESHPTASAGNRITTPYEGSPA